MKKRTVYKHKLKNKVITGACATAASFALLSGTFLTNAFAQGSLATGTWVENEDVLNKDEAANEASVTAQTDKAPEGFSFDTKEDRLTFLIFYLSGDNQAFNGQSGTDWYIRLSRTRSVYDGVIYADLVDKATGNVIESLTVNPGESLHFSKIKEKNIATFDYSITTSKKEFKAGDESTTLYYVSLDSGMGGSTQGTVKYSSVTKNETDALYNNWAGVVPQSPMSQKTSYVKKSDGSILAEYTQKGGIFGDNYSAAGEAKFEKYELVEAPAVKTGVLNGASVGTYIIEARYSHKEARIKFNTKSDGTQRIAMMIINPNHPDFVNNYNNATLDADFLDINRLSEIIYDDKIPEKDKVKTFNESNPKYVVMFLSKDIAPGEYNKESSGYGDDGTWTYTLNDTLTNGKNEIEGGLTEKADVNEPYGNWKIIEYTLNKDGQAYKFGGMYSSLKNGNIPTPSDAVYYYANKGGVKVYYIDKSGKEIADPVFALPYADSNTEYNTEDERYTKITAQDGEVYYFKEIDSNIKNPSESDESNGFRTVVKITDEQGQVVQNTLKELSYVYEKAGNVNINYVNTDGEVIKKKVNDVVNGEPGSDYDTTTADKKPEKILDDNGKTYVYKEIKNGSADASGVVVAGQTIEVTYVYEEVKGNVTVKYHDEDGNPIEGTSEDGKNVSGPVTDTYEASTGTDYDTTDNKPKRIITSDGTIYELVPELTQGNEKGKVVEGETEVIYVYKKIVSDNSKIDPNAPNSDKSNGSGENSDIKLSSVKTENAPKTGDYSKLPIYVSLAGVAAAILTVMGFKIKKNKR